MKKSRVGSRAVPALIGAAMLSACAGYTPHASLQTFVVQDADAFTRSAALATQQRVAMQVVQTAPGRVALVPVGTAMAAAPAQAAPIAIAAATPAPPPMQAAPAPVVAAGPVVILPPETQVVSTDDRRSEIEQAMQAWKLAWELGDADTYLRFYESSFRGDAPSRPQWEKQRRARLANKNIGVRFDKVRTRMLSDTEAEVQFVQHYTSGRHQDVGSKRLQMKRVGGAWKITQESWKGM
jgi:hypothetical protein